ARLKELVVTGGEKLKPDFVPNTTAYKVKLPTGTKSLTFTPVPIAPGATVTVNGNNAEVGKPSLPYEPIEVISTVTIVVTAQDGKTKMTYTVEVNNLNLVPKSSDADLASLVIREGSMSPPFKAGVTEYNVAVKDEVAFVDILPSTRNEEATMVVKADSKVLGDYYDRYSTAIRDGDNEITVEVTAEDGKTKKLYTVNVYRKDEEQQGAYKPITVDMINFSENPIVVDISKYTTISAEVFNTLKEKYPDKTMVFEGNDYSLQLTGKSIEMLVPHAVIYDLGITFTTPEDEAIWKIIDGEPKNNGIEPVFIHFNHHGALPGKMLFTLSLGRTYRTQNSTWNYYNDERDRIDYYGGIRTNSRGTFTVPISHMSTYIYCSKRIVGAENKSGNLGDIGDITGNSGVAGATGSVGKPNPNTGVGGQGE
ncbi:MAG: cadherin-like beta sandwich domain-containing protein, partial [Angelakisella sp.]